MSYWVNVAANATGWPIANATFFAPSGAQYAASYQGNAWYFVGVGPNQDFQARAPGYYDSVSFNTDSVDPNNYYFWFRLNLIPPPPSPPPTTTSHGWA
jgi:hypothetical protein